MNHAYRTLLAATLALMFEFPVLAADAVAAKKAPAPASAGDMRRTPTPVQSEPRPGDAAYQELSGQTVYQILLAEIALQRGNAELASQAYADLALRTRDPKLLERTVEVAGYARRYDLAIEAARLWLEVEPTSQRAQKMLTSMLIMSERLDDLAPQLIRMLELDKEALGTNLLGLNRMLARNPNHQSVFQLIDKVCAPFFGIAEAHYAIAMAASSAGEHARALAETQRALELRPDWEAAALLEAQLLASTSPTEAILFLQRFLERNANARDVELHLARALIGEKRYAEAKHHFDRLLLTYPDSLEVVYPVAILALQLNDTALAEKQLKRLLTLDFADRNLVYFYLGQIAEENRRSKDALAYYAKIDGGDNYLPAQIRSAHLLAEKGDLDAARHQLHAANAGDAEGRAHLTIAEAQLLRQAKRVQDAFDLLEKSLSEQPQQAELLYESALMAEKLGRVDVLESRLRKLIELQPDSAQGYNALGYSLADRNLRLPEARELIEKAVRLSPDDAFILDSLGWVLYRQGELPAALVQLERAYKLRPDPEIAAHLGEILWMLGRQDDARKLWQDAGKKHPANEELAETVRRFAP